MGKLQKKMRWIVPGAMLYALGGCTANPQLLGFLRTEVARLTADAVREVFLIYIQATT